MEIGRIEKGLARNKEQLRLSENWKARDFGTLCIHCIAASNLDNRHFIISRKCAWGSLGDSFTTEHYSKILGGDQFWVWMTNS